ncbi:copper amine oxidase N-terminal domain-containing protein [Wukongibacter baidiensis]|uniref:copper amine oxidase N-terminal domain-containing protein n=1 Tax=Wukongibacter baidiensis TaxID=1723361 RepID=UPI003D7FD0A8
MKNRLIKLFKVTLIMMFIFNIALFSVEAENVDLKVMVNNKLVNFPDAKPFINEDDRTLVPVRFIAENLGCQVEWNGEIRQVGIVGIGKEIKLNIGENKALVGGKKIEFDTKSIIKDDRTFVPLRFVSEALGAKVEWNGESRSIKISTNEIKGEELERPDRVEVRNIFKELRETTIDENNKKEFVEPVFAIDTKESYIDYYLLIVKNMSEYKATGDEYKIRFIVLDERGNNHPILNSYYDETDEWFEQDMTIWKSINKGNAWWGVRKFYLKEKDWDKELKIEEGAKFNLKIIIRNETRKIEKEYFVELVAGKGGE